MPITLEMQDLVTVSFNILTMDTTATSIQSEGDWIDVGGWQDLMVMVYFQQLGSVSTTSPYTAAGFYIDNAPVKEESFFSGAQTQLAVYNGATATPPTQGAWNPYGPYHQGYAGSTVPPTFFRYLRWRVIGFYGATVSTWAFRIILSGNPAPR
jgi:hypothetical protein